RRRSVVGRAEFLIRDAVVAQPEPVTVLRKSARRDECESEQQQAKAVPQDHELTGIVSFRRERFSTRSVAHRKAANATCRSRARPGSGRSVPCGWYPCP